jgi:uncharacterized phage protein (TIGR02218 family)
MTLQEEALYSHLETGASTVCRAWAIVRRDGKTFGFTDHDRGFSFDGIDFKASSGLTARALQQTTGLSVDNTEALGALSDAAVTEGDIVAGRFDGADVRAWLVNWAAVDERLMQFRGSFGEITRAGGAFQAELRGLTEALNQLQGRVYQRPCSAILGDESCRVDLAQPGYAIEAEVEIVEDHRVFRFSGLPGFDDRWFEKGRFEVLSGVAQGSIGVVKNDRSDASGRMIELWQSVQADVRPGDLVRITAGCDKRPETCRLKFLNFLNFRGFPTIPGEDWLSSYPARAGVNDGGSLTG